MYFAGIDIGSSYTKAVIIDEKGDLLSHSIQKTGVDFARASDATLEEALSRASLKRNTLTSIASTGIGRHQCKNKSLSKTEIGCLAKGVFFQFGGPCTVIDIGGQDNKVIQLSAEGKQLDFKMNRKCAAGTGSFLEEIAFRLDLKTDEMNRMAKAATESVPVNSYCTVFAGTEIIHHLRCGDNTNGIMKGVFESVVKRVIEMAPIVDKVVLTGGAVATSPALVDIFQERLENEILLPKEPQVIGAWGAALYAKESVP